MTALRRILAILLSLVLMVAGIAIAANANGLGGLVVMLYVAIFIGAATLVEQLYLFLTLKQFNRPVFDFFYWHTFASAVVLVVLYAMICRMNYVMAVLFNNRNILFGYHTLFLLPFLLQIVLLVCRSVRSRRGQVIYPHNSHHDQIPPRSIQ